MNESTSAVLPIPASPRTSASLPRPVSSTVGEGGRKRLELVGALEELEP